MKRYFPVLLIGSLMVFLVACASSSWEKKDKEKMNGHQAPKEESGIVPVGAYSLQNDGVNPVVFKKLKQQLPKQLPLKIATTSVPLAEMLHALGIIPIGVPSSTNPLPEEFKAIKKIGNPMSPDLEVITKLQPDLVLSSEALRSTLDKSLHGLNLRVSYLRTDTLDDLKLSFKILGTYFGKQDEMNKVLSRILTKENELIKGTKGKKSPKALLMVGTSDSFMVMNKQSYLGSLVKKANIDNIAESILKVKGTYTPINMESIVAADPEVILVLASGDHGASKEMFQKQIEQNSQWEKIAAYKNNKIHLLDSRVFGVTSIANVEKALAQIATYFYS